MYFSCGILMLATAERLALQKPLDFKQSDAPALRANLQTVLAIQALCEVSA